MFEQIGQSGTNDKSERGVTSDAGGIHGVDSLDSDSHSMVIFADFFVC